MKTFQTARFLVRGFEEDSSICYLVDGLTDESRMGYFEVTESKQNASVLAVYLNMTTFKEVFTEYQKQLNVPVLFWDGDFCMTSDVRQALMSMGAKHFEDKAKETRWGNKPNNKVYKLGE